MAAETRYQDHFSLSIIAGELSGFRMPRGPFEPEGAWRHEYRVLTLTGATHIAGRGGRDAGRLRVERLESQGGAYPLEVELTRQLAGGTTHWQLGTIRCLKQEWPMPVSWKLESELRDGGGKAIRDTRIEKSARFGDGVMRVMGPGRERRIDVAEPFAVSWSLFDYVQRMPADSEPLPFLMLDHYDQPKPNQRLAHRTSCDVLVGERRVQRQRWKELEKGRIRTSYWATEGGAYETLHAFEQTGWGIVPWAYWRDGAGRLLFAVSGLEAYILDSYETEEG